MSRSRWRLVGRSPRGGIFDSGTCWDCRRAWPTVSGPNLTIVEATNKNGTAYSTYVALLSWYYILPIQSPLPPTNCEPFDRLDRAAAVCGRRQFDLPSSIVWDSGSNFRRSWRSTSQAHAPAINRRSTVVTLFEWRSRSSAWDHRGINDVIDDLERRQQ
jgi:hypothetical protein